MFPLFPHFSFPHLIFYYKIMNLEEIKNKFIKFQTSLMAQKVKPLFTMQETWVRSLGWEDPLEKEMATHFSILAWRFSHTEEPGGLQSMGSQRVGHD